MPALDAILLQAIIMHALQSNTQPLYITQILQVCAFTYLYHRPLTHNKLSLKAKPCNEDGHYLPPGSFPEDENDDNNEEWAPFSNRPSFQFASFAYRKAELSGGDINELLDIWAAHNILHDGGDPPFLNKDDLYATIDSIRQGNAPWEAFSVRYEGPLTADAPSWKRATYRVYCRNTHTVAHNMLASPDFDRQFDYAAYEEYAPDGSRHYSNVMSGKWAYRKSVSSECYILSTELTVDVQTVIAQDPATHGAMLVPVLAGADKTTVSIATGQNDFHPLYMSLGNVHNKVRRAHQDAIIPVAFLAIPKSTSILLLFEYRT